MYPGCLYHPGVPPPYTTLPYPALYHPVYTRGSCTAGTTSVYTGRAVWVTVLALLPLQDPVLLTELYTSAQRKDRARAAILGFPALGRRFPGPGRGYPAQIYPVRSTARLKTE